MKLTPEQLKQNAAAMIAFAEGKPIECLNRGGVEGRTPFWGMVRPEHHEIDTTNFLYRLKHEPQFVPWDCPADVPGPVCWLGTDDQNDPLWKNCGSMVIGIDPEGVITLNSNDFLQKITWEYLKCEKGIYSTDRITWKPCTKPAAQA